MPTKKDKPNVQAAALEGYNFLSEFGSVADGGNGMVQAGADELAHTIIPTGNLAIDALTPYMGMECGDWVALVGDENVGKTTLCYLVMANAITRFDMPVLYIDAENRFDANIARKNGLDVDNKERFFLVQWRPPDPTKTESEQKKHISATLNNSTSMIRRFLDDKRVVRKRENGQFYGGVVIIDSVNLFMTKGRENTEPGDKATGFETPKIFSQWAGELMGRLRHRNSLFITVLQFRANVQMGTTNPNAPKTTVPGGFIFKFAPSLTLELKRTVKEPGPQGPKGVWIKATALKNTGGRFLYSQEYLLTTDAGVDQDRLAMDYGEKIGLVKKRGSWLDVPTLDGVQSFNGVSKVKEYFAENPARRVILSEQIRNKILSGVALPAPAKRIEEEDNAAAPIDGGVSGDSIEPTEAPGQEEG